jgi:Zn-dependent peptidase ImmA (M78 family)
MKQLLVPSDVCAAKVLATLRGAIPPTRLRYSSALAMAEQAASSLLSMYDASSLPVSTAIVADLPKISVTVDSSLPEITSGLSVWNSRVARWVISINGAEPRTRQRFTIFHEFFHVMVHRHVERYGIFDELSPAQIEYIADYFSGCTLVPKRLLMQAWGRGHENPESLGRLFDVSPQAIAVRLKQVGLPSQNDLSSSTPQGASR